jgi:hypothetical protein
MALVIPEVIDTPPVRLDPLNSYSQARFQWHAGPDDKPDTYAGFDVIVTEDGRIRNVYGFTDVGPGA